MYESYQTESAGLLRELRVTRVYLVLAAERTSAVETIPHSKWTSMICEMRLCGDKLTENFGESLK